MLYREVIAVCSEIHTKHKNTLCGQNVESLNVKPGGTYSNHWALRSYCGYRLLTSTLSHTKKIQTKKEVTKRAIKKNKRQSIFK
jgi:hypothetical protein